MHLNVKIRPVYPAYSSCLGYHTFSSWQTLIVSTNSLSHICYRERWIDNIYNHKYTFGTCSKNWLQQVTPGTSIPFRRASKFVKRSTLTNDGLFQTCTVSQVAWLLKYTISDVQKHQRSHTGFKG